MTDDFVPREPRASNVLIYTLTQAISATGTWAQRTAMGWQVWVLTHSPAWVGALALTELAALFLAGPFAGAVTDRQSPFRMLMTTQSLMVTQAACLALLVFSGKATVEGLFALALLDSCIQAFNNPVRQTAMSLIAPRETLSQAIAANSIAFNLARIVGPAAAGLIMAHHMVAPVFAMNSAFNVVMIGTVIYLRPWISRPVKAAGGKMFAEVVAGVRYVQRTPEIATVVMLAAAFALLVRPFGELLPAFAGQVLHGGPQTLSSLMSCQGAGAMIGATWMLRRRPVHRLFLVTFAAGIGLPTAILCMMASPGVHWAMGAIAFAGCFHVVCNIGMQSLCQLHAEEAYRGRVMSLFSMIFRAGPSIGAFLIGLAAVHLDIRFLVGGCALVGAALIARLWIHSGHSMARKPAPTAPA